MVVVFGEFFGLFVEVDGGMLLCVSIDDLDWFVWCLCGLLFDFEVR